MEPPLLPAERDRRNARFYLWLFGTAFVVGLLYLSLPFLTRLGEPAQNANGPDNPKETPQAAVGDSTPKRN